MLFLFDKVKNVIIYPEALELTDHIKKLGKKDQVFLILYLDYNSPFNQHPEDIRLQMAKRDAYNDADYDHLKVKHMVQAINEYNALQYDYRRENIRKYTQLINNLSNQLITETIPKKISDIDDAIKKLDKRIQEMQEALDNSVQEIVLKGDKQLSLIEQWQRKMVEYKRKIAQQETEVEGSKSIDLSF